MTALEKKILGLILKTFSIKQEILEKGMMKFVTTNGKSW